jgi:metallo-beta-lactamase class B
MTLLLLSFQFAGYAQTTNKINLSDDITLIKLSEHAYVHVSVSEFQGFGKVSSNGLLLVNDGEAFLFDTQATNAQTETLFKWVTDSLHAIISTFIPNHWHEDCIGGLEYLHTQGIKSYANQKTIDIAKQEEKPVPQQGFNDSLLLKLNDIDVCCYYLGGGHTIDNIVVWIPSERILFGGCMLKDAQSKGLGNLSDAVVEDWPETIKKVIDKFPTAEIVIPGHGQTGGKDVLTHTLELLIK